MRASIIVIISVGRGDRTRDLEAALALSSREMGISVRGGGTVRILMILTMELIARERQGLHILFLLT